MPIPAHARPAPPPLTSAIADAHAALSGDPGVWRGFFEVAGHLAVNLAAAGLILVATLWISGAAGRLARRTLSRLPAGAGVDATLPTFIGSLVRWAIVVLGLVEMFQQLGVRTTSILAVLGAASLAIGLALQGALGNVAAGVMILIMRPYRVGDWVEINGKSGVVKRLDLFMTELSDADNLDIFMPNSKVVGEMIVNYSSAPNRRMELQFRVDYADDLDVALGLLLASAKADPRILDTPAPWAKVTALGDSAVTLTLRAWASLPDYWEARFDMIKRVAQALRAAGMTVPYPHQVQVEKGGAG